MPGFFRSLTKTFFIAANVIAALIFIAACYGHLLNPERFWFFGLLTFAAIWLLFLLIGFLIFWAFIKPRFLLISIIALAVCWNAIGHLFKFRLPDNFSKEKPAESIRVFDWNAEHFGLAEHAVKPEKKQQMVDLVKSYHPDIACFQEMTSAEGDPSAINDIDQFKKAFELPYHYYSYDPAIDFDGKHHFGIAVLSRFPILSAKTMRDETHNYNSIFQYTDLLTGSDTVRVINIHLQSLKFSGDNRKYLNDPSVTDQSTVRQSGSILKKLRRGFLKRKTQADAVRAVIDASPYPVIVCGDFNDVPLSYAYEKIGHGLLNAFAEKGSGIDRTYTSISPTLRIDNIFLSKKFEVLQFERVKKRLSDHFAVVADFKTAL